MLGPGDRIPDARVWAGTRQAPIPLSEAIAGEGPSLLCFYPFDWSPGCTNELSLLRARGEELEQAGIRTFGISRDSPWSHAAWAMMLDVENVGLLSDWEGEATHGFSVAREVDGMKGVPMRCAFLIEGDTVIASWNLGSDQPDIDAVIAAASSLSR